MDFKKNRMLKNLVVKTIGMCLDMPRPRTLQRDRLPSRHGELAGLRNGLPRKWKLTRLPGYTENVLQTGVVI